MLCTLCLEGCEFVDHLFMGCPCTKAILLNLLPDKLSVTRCSSVSALWEVYSPLRGAAGGYALRSIAATWWAVWLERNQRCFELKKRPLTAVLADVRELRDLWNNCPS